MQNLNSSAADAPLLALPDALRAEHAAEFEAKESSLEEGGDALALLRGSEERFRLAFDNAAIGKALVGLDGRFTQVNRSLCGMLGYTERELLNTNFQAITHPEDLNADLTFVERLVAGEIPHYQMHKRYIHKFGHLVAAQLSVSLVRDKAGKPSYFISQIQDMTERLRLETALRSSEEEHRAMFQLAGVGKAQTDLATGRFCRVNQKFCEMIGYSAEEAVGLSFAQITPPEDAARSRALADEMLRGDLIDYTFEKRYIRKDGRIIWVSINATVIREPTGKIARAVATIVDITDRKRGEIFEADRSAALEMIVRGAATAEVLRRLSQAVERQISGCCAGFMLVESGGVTVVGADSADAWWAGLARGAMGLAVKLSAQAWGSAGNCGVTFLGSDAMWENLKAAAAERGIKACWSVPLQGADGAALGLLTVFCRDERQPSSQERLTLDAVGKLAAVAIEHHNTSEQLSHWVRHDALTGLPNRIKFEDHLDESLAAAGEDDAAAALLMIDIDHFKSINDTLGHKAGDHLLQQFAQRLKGHVQAGDIMARLGGDEFAIILTKAGDGEGAREIAGAIIESMRGPFELPGAPAAVVTASIGIALFPSQARDGVMLQELADTAMYRAKSNGRNRYHVSP